MVLKRVFLEENLKVQFVYKHGSISTLFGYEVKTFKIEMKVFSSSLLGMIYN